MGLHARIQALVDYIENIRVGAHPAPGNAPFLLSYFWALADRVFAPYATYRRDAAKANRTIPIIPLTAREQDGRKLDFAPGTGQDDQINDWRNS